MCIKNVICILSDLFRPFVDFPLVALRRISAILGASLIPIMYITIRSLGHSRSAATLAAGLLIFGILKNNNA